MAPNHRFETDGLWAALALMRQIRWFLALALFVASVPLFVIGTFVAMNTDWQPMHAMEPDELRRIEVASQFVEHHVKNFGRIPTSGEFKLWADSAPSELHLDGVGFTYFPSSSASSTKYVFQFWEGDATVTWHSGFGDKSIGAIAPQEYFLTGSKFSDLLVFYGIGIALLVAARSLAPAKRESHVR